MKKKVSVIMSVYNEKKEWIKESIDSILEQTYTNIEFIIILDNPNNFEAENLIKKYCIIDKRIIFIKNKKNLGLVKSLNIGLNRSTGYYIARMDADDISVNTRIERQVEYLTYNLDIDLLVTEAKFINEVGESIGKSVRFKSKENLMKSLRYKNRLIHPTWMFKSYMVKSGKINGYRDIPYAEDYDMACRIIVNGFVIDQLHEELLYYRIRENGITNSKYYSALKSSTFISEVYRKYNFEVEYVSKCNLLISDRKGEDIFNYINKKVNSKVIKLILGIACKYYRKANLNYLICRLKYNV